MYKHKTAVRRRLNLLGRRARRRLSLKEVLAMEFSGMSRGDILDLLDMGYRLPVMAGGTSKQNQQAANPVYFPKALLVTTDQTINQGDMVWWDDVHFTLKPLTAIGQVAYVQGAGAGGFCGCAAGSNVPGVYPNPPAGAPSENLPGIEVQRGGSVFLNSTTGDGTYFPFEPVTVGADAQTITRGAETTADRVGFVVVQLPVTAAGAAGATPAPPTAAGGARTEVWLESKFPTTVLL